MASHFGMYTSDNLPPELEPLSPWAYFGLTILFSLPVIGQIFIIVFSISGANYNRRNFARSYLIAYLILAIVLVIAFFTGALAGIVNSVTGGNPPEFLSFVTGA